MLEIPVENDIDYILKKKKLKFTNNILTFSFTPTLRCLDNDCLASRDFCSLHGSDLLSLLLLKHINKCSRMLALLNNWAFSST